MGRKFAFFNNGLINILAPLIGSSRTSSFMPKNSNGLFRSVIYFRYVLLSEPIFACSGSA
jgi:hypothetical protein